MPDMKTPGVYIVETNAFPNSIVEVATGVPAFVGYTQKADDDGRPLLGRAVRISSMVEFERCFGQAAPVAFAVRGAANGEGGDVRAPDGTDLVVELTSPPFRLHAAMRHFFANGGGPCWIVSAADFAGGAIAFEPLARGLAALGDEAEHTLLVIPEAVELDAGACADLQRRMLAHCAGRNRFAILDVPGGTGDAAQGEAAVDAFRATLGDENLKWGAAYYPFVHTRLRSEGDLSYSDFPGTAFSTFLTDLPPALAPVAKDAERTDEAWRAELEAAKAAGAASVHEDEAAWIAGRKALTHKALVQGSPFFANLLRAATGMLNLMPPSAAMAGVYTLVDETRGVWKAPANVSLNGVVEPAVAVSHADQETLNVHPTGKSINAIRAFAGKGVLVWGARTLDGNSLDWRYINVRRTVSMLEESCRLAVQALVFEPNVASTWVTARRMIENYLTGVWRRGGLAGATPDDAFAVRCGLGETMTQQDILDGTLRVTILVALSRPAEFIAITFQQQMQTS
jgi:uncharacterized protein